MQHVQTCDKYPVRIQRVMEGKWPPPGLRPVDADERGLPVKCIATSLPHSAYQVIRLGANAKGCQSGDQKEPIWQ